MNTFTIRRANFSNHADGSDAALTFHDIVGQATGPTVGISGAIHGNEPTGTEIILDLYRALQSIPVRGRIVLLPVANPRAYAQNRRFTTIDELNLNREFPGDPNGSYTQQLAGALTDGTSLGSCGPKMIREHVSPILNEAASIAGRPTRRPTGPPSSGSAHCLAGRSTVSSTASSASASSISSSSVLKAESILTGASWMRRGTTVRSTARSITACEPLTSSLGMMNTEMP